MSQVTWHAEKVLKRLRKQLVRGAFKAGSYARNGIRKDINRRNPQGRLPSKPGEAPRRISGRLRGNVLFKVDQSALGVTAYVGIHKRLTWHAISLERGRTERGEQGQIIDLAPRPFIVPAVHNRRHKIGRLLAGMEG